MSALGRLPHEMCFSIPVRKLSALRTLPHDNAFLYTCEVLLFSEDNFPMRIVFSIPVRKLSDLCTTSPRDVFSLYL